MLLGLADPPAVLVVVVGFVAEPGVGFDETGLGLGITEDVPAGLPIEETFRTIVAGFVGVLVVDGPGPLAPCVGAVEAGFVEGFELEGFCGVAFTSDVELGFLGVLLAINTRGEEEEVAMLDGFFS